VTDLHLLRERRLSQVHLGRARADAAARVAEADIAAAAALAARFQAVTAGLQHFAALAVAAGARDAAAILRVFTLAVAAAEVEVAHLDAVPSATAGACAVAESLAKTLQRGTGDGIVACAVDSEPALALLKAQLASRHDAHIRRGSGGGGIGREGGRRTCRKGTPTFGQYSAGHKQHSFDERDCPGIGRRGRARVSL